MEVKLRVGLNISMWRWSMRTEARDGMRFPLRIAHLHVGSEVVLRLDEWHARLPVSLKRE